MILTQKRLKVLLHYNPDTGIFTWLVDASNNAKSGKIAGSLGVNGYVVITINLKRYYAHRLVFLYMSGEFPNDQADHINGIRADNRWENLREATNQENSKNQGLQSNNKSGITGVLWNKINKNWRAAICIDGKAVCLGSYRFIVLAVIARKKAEIKYKFHTNHGVKR